VNKLEKANCQISGCQTSLVRVTKLNSTPLPCTHTLLYNAILCFDQPTMWLATTYYS